jgi:hypothetical protein
MKLSTLSLEYTIRKVKYNQKGLKVTETYQLLVYTDDINLLGENIMKTRYSIRM